VLTEKNNKFSQAVKGKTNVGIVCTYGVSIMKHLDLIVFLGSKE
jgi:hypothetical protein